MHAQQHGLSYCGVGTPLGRLTTHQFRALAHLADVYGSGALRLTPWQNVLIPDVSHQQLAILSQALDALGLPGSATHPWSALVACAGSLGCRASATNTTQHALALAHALAQHSVLDHPLNLHLSGCPKSCAQHYPSDIALLGTAIPQGEAIVEGYHVHVGTTEQPFGRVLYHAVPAAHLTPLLRRVLQAYRTYRQSPAESFGAFANRYTIAELQQFVDTLAAPPDHRA
jgi:ferredoxin-nitrite reductase